MQTQASQQVMDEAEKEHKKISDRINEGREAMKVGTGFPFLRKIPNLLITRFSTCHYYPVSYYALASSRLSVSGILC